MSYFKTVVKNIGFIYSSLAVAKLLGIVSTVILARLLVPSDFGIIGLAGFVTGLVSQFADFGIGMSLVVKKDEIVSARNVALYMYIAIGVILYIIAYFSAPFASSFFNEPVIEKVIRISAIGLILNSFGIVNRWLLIRELSFKKIAKIDVKLGIIVTIATVFLAYHGFSFWSIVYGSLIGAVIEVLLLWNANPWRPTIEFDKKSANELLNFGKYVFLSTAFVFFVRNVDNVMAGKFFGTIIAGYYMLAFKFGNYSTTLITNVVSSVIFPTFSKIRDDLGRLRKGYLIQLKYISMISIPVAFGSFAIAREFIIVILGNKWTYCIPLLQILCFLGLFRSLGSGAGSVFLAVERPEMSTKIMGIELLFIMIFIYPATSWFGIIGLCVLMTMAELFSIILQFITVNKILNISNISQLRLFRMPVLSSTVMVLIIYLIKEPLNNVSFILQLHEEPLLKSVIFLSLITTGVLAYSISFYVFTRGEILTELKELTSKIRSSKNTN